jgi:hypothetical protein
MGASLVGNLSIYNRFHKLQRFLSLHLKIA